MAEIGPNLAATLKLVALAAFGIAFVWAFFKS